LLHAYTVEKSGSALGTAVLCTGGLASIYTEFLAFELLLVAAFLALAVAQRPRGLWHTLGYGLLLASPWLCNPLYRDINMFLQPTTLGAAVLGHIYPWAYGEICPAVLWVGDFCVKPVVMPYHKPGIWLGFAVFLAGAAGLAMMAVHRAIRWWRRGRQSADAAVGLALALLGLALVPALMLLAGRDHPYQFVKLLITVSPLYALGVVLLTNMLARAGIGSGGARPGIVWLPVLLVTAVASVGSARMVVQSTDPTETAWRTHQEVALSPHFRRLRRQLEAMHGWDLLVRPGSNHLGYQQIWTLYFARHNRVWMAWPLHNDGWSVHDDGSLDNLVNLDRLPERFAVLCPRQSAYLQPPKNLPPSAIVWQSSAYLIWQYDGGPWACVTDIDNPNGNEIDDHCYWLGGGDTVVRLFATESGVVHLHLGLGRGPCIDPAEKIALIIKDNQGSEALVEMAPGPLVLPVAVHKGTTAVTLRPLNAKRHIAGIDPRPLLAQLRVERLTFRPQPAGAAWACLGRVDNPNHFEDEAQQRIWLGGGDTLLQVWASDSGVARFDLHVVRGPCLDPAESPLFQVVTNQSPTQAVALAPGRQTLEVPVVKGLNTIRVRTLNEPHGHAEGDSRMLMAQWTLGDITLHPASPPAAASPHGN